MSACDAVAMLRTVAASYALLSLGVALGWLGAALCYAARRSEEAQRAVLEKGP